MITKRETELRKNLRHDFRKNFPDLMRREIHSMRQEGYSAVEIVNTLGINYPLYSRYIGMENTRTEKPQAEKPQTEKSRMGRAVNQFYKDGMSPDEISKKTKIPFSVVRQMLARNLRPLDQINKEEVTRLYKEGYHPKQIAPLVGWSHTTIRRALGLR